MSHIGKPDGIYEEVISKQLSNILREVDDNAKYAEKLDVETAPDVLAEYVSRIIKHRLELVKEKSNDISEQINLVNKLIEVVSTEDDNYSDEMVAEPGEQLRALLEDPITYIADKKAEDLVRPVTSIADTSLFTGAGREPSLASEINKEIESCDRIDMMVSFIRWSGYVLIRDELRKFVEKGGKLRIITTSYMGVTELRAIEELAQFPNTEIKVSFDGERTRLHAKVYVFHRNTGYSTAYVGSSNMTEPAMTSGCEWNVKITRSDLPEVFRKIEASYDGYWESKDFESYSTDRKEQLAEALSRAGNRNTTNRVHRQFFCDVHPFSYQEAILDKMDAERDVRGSFRNLICAATGTGKTIISAFDYRRQCEKHNKRLKLLFVAHRREILEQSIECYREIMKDFGFADVFYSGHSPVQLDYLFVSIDMINSRRFVDLQEDYYDYIVIDECHHMAAKSYKILFEHFKPMYFVGLTATPERMDGESILPYFNNRLAAEIRLPEAIDRKLLCPFQYFGVADSVDLSSLRWTRGGYDKSELENVYVLSRAIADKRARLIIQSLNRYVCDMENTKGLVFCVSIEHAKYMSEKFNEAGIETAYLTGKSPESDRMSIKNKLQNGDLKFVCVVDLYNEGVDIKEINTVLFLRPTESLTVFLQQLGRGLRLCKGKDCLTVLDFIGRSNEKYNFQSKYEALIQRSNAGLKKEIEGEFPHLPRGCYIKLEKKAKEAIIANLSKSMSGKTGVVSRIQSYAVDMNREFALQDFLSYYSMTPKMIYKHHITASGVINNINENADKEIAKRIFRLASVDSAEVLRYWIQHMDELSDVSQCQYSAHEMYYWKMLFATFIDGVEPQNDVDVMTALSDFWNENQIYTKEIKELIQYNFNSIDFIEQKMDVPFDNVMNVYSTYTRAQALALLDYWKTSSEGVTRVEDKKTTCLFVTLNKGNNYYSPTTAYHDYSINDELFHWQSQNSTASYTEVGKRYINHKTLGENIFLFVREQKDDQYGSVPFVFLGPAQFVSYKGEKPMNIVWKLDYKIPAKFVAVTDKLGIG